MSFFIFFLNFLLELTTSIIIKVFSLETKTGQTVGGEGRPCPLSPEVGRAGMPWIAHLAGVTMEVTLHVTKEGLRGHSSPQKGSA